MSRRRNKTTEEKPEKKPMKEATVKRYTHAKKISDFFNTVALIGDYSDEMLLMVYS